jgi:hypothetical protein
VADDLEDFEFAVAERFPGYFSRRRRPVLATPRELADYLLVAQKSQPAPDQRSIKQHAFYSIRTLFATRLRRSRGEIGPRTPLRDLLPDPQRRRSEWSAITAALGIPHFPQLHRPSTVQWSMTLTVAVLSFAVFLIAGFRLGGSSALLGIGLLSTAVLCALLLRATQKHATLFGPPTLTIGDLAAYATAYGSRVSGLSIKPTTRSQYLEIVRDLVRLEIGASKINDDATWDELSRSARSAP